MFPGNDAVLAGLKQGMDVASLRQKVIANNLANINTSRFQRSYVSFEEELKKAREEKSTMDVWTTHPGHFSGKEPREPVTPQVKVEDSVVRRIDGNNVDMEKEMIGMVTNQLRYNALTQQTSSRLNTWEYVIHQGRR